MRSLAFTILALSLSTSLVDGQQAGSPAHRLRREANPTELNRIADSLTSVALTVAERQSDSSAFLKAARAVSLLAFAGTDQYDDIGPPYAGAVDRLVRIYDGTNVEELKQQIITYMQFQAPRQRAFAFLERVMVSGDVNSYRAFYVLSVHAYTSRDDADRAAAIAILRRAYENGAVSKTTSGPTWSALEFMAERFGWRQR